MRFEVPQFVDVEDKIFGPFTWKQFVYLAGGGGAGFILYATLPFIIFVLVAAPIVALAAGLAFYKINEQPLSVMVEAVVTYFSRGRLYLWKKDPIQEATTPAAPETAVSALGHNNINSLARSLEMKALNQEK